MVWYCCCMVSCVVGAWSIVVSLWLGEVGLASIGCEGGVADGMMNGLISELLGFICFWFLEIILSDPSRWILYCWMVKPQQLFHFAANVSCFSFLNSALTLGSALVMTVGIECGCCCSGWLFFVLVVGNAVLVVLLIGSIVYGAYVLGLLVCGL